MYTYLAQGSPVLHISVRVINATLFCINHYKLVVFQKIIMITYMYQNTSSKDPSVNEA